MKTGWLRTIFFAARRKRHRSARDVKKVTPLFLLLLSFVCASAQSFQFLPETDAYYKVNRSLRLDFQVKAAIEAGDPTRAEIGPSIDLFVKPLLSLERIPIFDPDMARTRLLQWFVGYRYVHRANNAGIDRMQAGFVANLPLPSKVLLSDRNRADLDWSTDPFAWKYRNRVKLQRSVSIRSYLPAPYASAEVIYQSRYAKWSDTALYAGCLFPIGARFAIDGYYEHQNRTGKQPNQQLNQFGVILNMYFGKRKG